MAEPVPEAPDRRYPTVGYHLDIDADGDGVQHYDVVVRSEDGWFVDLFDHDTGATIPIGDAQVAHKSLFGSVPLSVLSLTPEARFHGLREANISPRPGHDFEWEDHVPDGQDDRQALGEFSGEVATEEMVRPPLRDLSALLETKQPEADFAEVKARFLAYLDEHPATITTATNRDIGIERDHWWSLCEPELDRGRTLDSYCNGAIQDLLIAYADTRDDGLYDLRRVHRSDGAQVREGQAAQDLPFHAREGRGVHAAGPPAAVRGLTPARSAA